MREVRVGSCTITPDEIRHALLGRFRRTGHIRAPKPGEYYLGELQIGIGLHIGDKMSPREILEKVR